MADREADREAGQGRVSEHGQGSQRGTGSRHGPIHAALVAFEQAAVTMEAIRVREAGEQTAADAAELVAALEEASAAASGVRIGASGGLLSGPALAECAALLARRAEHSAARSGEIADAMNRAAALLIAEDEEVSNRVSRAAG